MTNPARLLPAILALLALGAVGLLLEKGARAEDGAATRQARTTWVYDVRVVRVDQTVAATVEVAPPWQPSGATGATTKAPWADLLTGLKARGRTTILLDQRVSQVVETRAFFRQDRKRMAVQLRNRQDSPQGKLELSDTSYFETGTKGELVMLSDGRLTYEIEVRWEEGSPTDGPAPIGSASWQGSAPLPAGETLVLYHRQQLVAGTTGLEGLEIHVLVTGWPVPPK